MKKKEERSPCPAARQNLERRLLPSTSRSGKYRKKALLKNLIVFAVLIAVGTTFMVLEARRDADTLALEARSTGPLTAEDVNTAFEKVSGKLVSRPAVDRNCMVKAGDVLIRTRFDRHRYLDLEDKGSDRGERGRD